MDEASCVVFNVVAYNIDNKAMKHTEHPGRSVATLREVIHKSQSQFAAMLGVSKHTIISVENGRNGLTPNLARRMYIATGVSLLKDLFHFVHTPGKNYLREDFESWRSSYYPGNDKTAKQQFGRMQFWIELLFKSAAKSGTAGNRDRLPALHLSLVEWLETARKEFKLESEIDETLETDTRYIGQERIPMWQLKLKADKFDEPCLKELAARLDVPYGAFKRELSKKSDRDVIVIEDEFRKAWADMFDVHDPLNEENYFQTPCAVRKLTSKAKYWFGKEDGLGNQIE